MHIRKTALALLAVGLLLPAAGWGQEGRLNGNFFTAHETQDEDNEACTTVEGTDFGIGGHVLGVDGLCEVEIAYFTFYPNKASATESSAKISQATFSRIEVTIRNFGLNDCPAETEYFGVAEPEKCKASSSLKGTSVPQDDDTVQSSKISVSCEIGSQGEDLSPTPPNNPQFDTLLDAFANRDDVTVDSGGKGRVEIKHAGLPDPDPHSLCATVN